LELYLRGVREDERRRGRLLLRSWGPRSGLATVTASIRRIGAEQGLAVIAAEQEDEPVQVMPQLGDVVCGVAATLSQPHSPRQTAPGSTISGRSVKRSRHDN
jgi:hypothetical protein